MDPDANLEEQRRLALQLVNDAACDSDTQRLAECVLALDNWLIKAGRLPKSWAANQPTLQCICGSENLTCLHCDNQVQ
jgi:hypothetical protein